MNDDPEGEEELAKEGPPRLIPAVDGVRYSGDDSHEVYDQKGRGGYQKRGPLEHVELVEVAVLVRSLGSDGEVRVDAGEHFEDTLKHGEKMGGDASDDPELLIPPPFVDANAAPSHLENAGGEDGQEERDEPNACKVADLRDDEFSSEKTNSRKGTIQEKWK